MIYQLIFITAKLHVWWDKKQQQQFKIKNYSNLEKTLPNIKSEDFSRYDPYEILDNKVFMELFLNMSVTYYKFQNNNLTTKTVHALLSHLLNVKGLGLYNMVYNMLANDYKKLRNEILRLQIKRLNDSSNNISFEIGCCFVFCTGLTYLRYKMVENGKAVGKTMKGFVKGLINWDIEEFSNALKTDDNIRIQAMKESLLSVIVLIANYYYYTGIKNDDYISRCINEILSFLNEQEEKNYNTRELFNQEFNFTLKYFSYNNLHDIFQNRDNIYIDMHNKFNNNETINTIIERFKVSEDMESGCFL